MWGRWQGYKNNDSFFFSQIFWVHLPILFWSFASMGATWKTLTLSRSRLLIPFSKCAWTLPNHRWPPTWRGRWTTLARLVVISTSKIQRVTLPYISCWKVRSTFDLIFKCFVDNWNREMIYYLERWYFSVNQEIKLFLNRVKMKHLPRF